MYKSGFFTFEILTITILSIALTSDLSAAGINTDVALPVREGGFVFRSQIRWLKATDDPTPVNREVNVVAIPNVLVYGATPDLSLFAIVPYIFTNVGLTETSSGKRIDKDDNGIGDTTLLGRYTVYARDYPAGDLFNRCVKIIQAAFLFRLIFSSSVITPSTNLFPV